MGVFILFLLATTLGSLTTLFWIPEEDLGRGYFQTNALVVLGLLALSVAVYLLHPLQPFSTNPALGATALWSSFAAAFLYYGATWKRRWMVARWAAGIATVACTIALLLAGEALSSPLFVLPHRRTLLVLSLLGSALLLGWSLIAMLLGHWYLVAPRLTFRHLVIFCWVLSALVVVRLLSVLATVAATASVEPPISPVPLQLLTGFAGQGMFFWFRLLWGLAGPLVLAFMALHCARHRSNQSATGILYVLVVGTFIGEVTAYYLLLTTGIPV